MGAVLETDERWRIIDRERGELADMLAQLSPEDWERPTQCDGWRVRDVAAHLTIAPRMSYGAGLREFLRARGDVNRMIHDTAVREGRRPVTEIVAELRATVGSRHLAPGTTRREPLIDILVHGQDIALALGREREMPVAAAVDAADRVWTMRFLRGPGRYRGPGSSPLTPTGRAVRARRSAARSRRCCSC
ncbi:maleylpyruvate isomerase family mycothiol-dependent enzyme [Streptomyces chiangmaiensis]